MNKNPTFGGKPNRSGAPVGKKHKPGGGRPSDWVVTECKRLGWQHCIPFLESVVKGDAVDEIHTIDGRSIPCKPSIKDRLKAIEMVMNRGYGMPVQQVESDSLSKAIAEFRDSFLKREEQS